MLYIREDILRKQCWKQYSRLEIKNEKTILKIYFTEIDLPSIKWLVSVCYNQKLNLIKNHLQEIWKGTKYFSKIDKTCCSTEWF